MTASDYKPVFYELKTTGGLALSPWCWRARMALAHKGIKPEIIQCGFSEIGELGKHGGKTFPLMTEADGTAFDDSATIIARAEEKIAEPTLYPGGDTARALCAIVGRHSFAHVYQAIIPIVIADVASLLDGADKEYFVSTREKRFGKPLAEICPDSAPAIEKLRENLEPYRGAVSETGFISGNAPALADYLVFGFMQWARVASPRQLLQKDDVLYGWMENMLDLYDGLARKQPARAS